MILHGWITNNGYQVESQGITFSEFWEIKKYKSGFCMTVKEKEWDVWR